MKGATSIRVLVVEDEFLIRMLLAEVLRDEGFEVIEAEDGDRAVSLIDGQNGFDLLLTDVHMPGSIDGIRVATHARQRHPHIPVIVLSAHPSNGQHLADLIPGCVFVGKPFELGLLVKMLWHMLAASDA